MKNLILALLLTCTSCAYIETYTLGPTPPLNAPRIHLVDSRSVEDKEFKPCPVNCPPIFKHRDSGFRPAVIDYLSYKLAEITGWPDETQVSLLKFEVIDYFPNRQKASSGAAVAAVSYPLALLMEAGVNYHESQSDFVVAAIKIRVFDRVYESVGFHSMSVYQTSGSTENGKSLTQLAVENALENLVSQIDS
ncbi:hypothetical protein [Alteromonas sp. KUL49]|uniref:hypothetical protein n=1 Tax=Alteromonas sp. KUL49 TaxID=2480798 RepID=UPI00102F0F70|nr:hypothetical protein [Alteromonas sp. KUL49]TAP40691.1 hypothetical protein EYS00_06125 [Alteromonas sp. KUL49]GEA10859.1 hypothetical protein KUL49_12340 [Alteromonas sp. KUL49]